MEGAVRKMQGSRRKQMSLAVLPLTWWVMLLLIGISSTTALATSLASQDSISLFKLLSSISSPKLHEECSLDVKNACNNTRCPHRIKCSLVDGKMRLVRLDLSGLDLVGQVPRDLFAHATGSLSKVEFLDLTPLSVSTCIPSETCGSSAVCLPSEMFCSSVVVASRSLQGGAPRLSDPDELRGWQEFYDNAGGDRWRDCGGPRARDNPCDPTICANGGIDRFVLCETKVGRTTLQVIRFQDNFVRGSLAESSVALMKSLNTFWIVNSPQATPSTGNVLFIFQECINLQMCYSGASCKFDGIGIALCAVSTNSPTRSPVPATPRPTTLSPTLQPTTRSPTSASPTSRAPTSLPTLAPRTRSPNRDTVSPTLTPTRYPTAMPTPPALSPQDAAAWQEIFSTLRGNFWDFCDQSGADPCNELTNGCAYHTYLRCNSVEDGSYRITHIFLQDNSLLGIVPEEAFRVLGPHLELLDLSSQLGRNKLGMESACLNLQFCYRTGMRCFFENSGPFLCAKSIETESPTMYAPLPVAEQLAWEQVYDDLNGGRWRGVCAGGEALRKNPCFFPACVQCISSAGFLHISGFRMRNVGLQGYLDDEVFWFLQDLTYLDMSNNKGVTNLDTIGISADDCIRAEMCFNPGTYCDFAQSGVSLCTTSLETRAPAFSGVLALDFPDLVAFNWFFTDLNGPQWVLPSSCSAVSLGDDPCFACPSRVRCIVSPSDASKLVIAEILLDASNLEGVLPLVPLNHLFRRGLARLSVPNSRLSLGEPRCLNLLPCFNGEVSCDFSNSGVSLCEPPIGMPATNSPTAPTRTPTMNAQNPCRTSGGLVSEGTPCAVPFTYSGIPFSSCISFAARPPLDLKDFERPRVPTDLWCPTARLYNLETASSWGFCDCSSSGGGEMTPAPFSQFTFRPTLSPTTRAPTPRTATLIPTTPSPTRRPTTGAPFSVTRFPTMPLTPPPSLQPTSTRPTSQRPSLPPSLPTSLPTNLPTQRPVSAAPSSTLAPSLLPTVQPSFATSVPTKSPTVRPLASPTQPPVVVVTPAPTREPTARPSVTFSPTKVPTLRPSTLEPTSKSPTLRPVTPDPTSKSPTARPSVPEPTFRAPTPRPSSLNPTNAPSKGPTAKPVVPTTQTKSPTTGIPTNSPTNRPSTPVPTARPTSQAPSKQPTSSPPTPSPVFLLSNDELASWQQIYDDLNGQRWIGCSEMRNRPCDCRTSGVNVKCATFPTTALRSSGRRQLQGGDGQTHITEINLPSNNLVGTLPTESVEQLPELQTLNMQGNAVVLPAGVQCADMVVCARTCIIGSTCDSTAVSLAPTSSRGLPQAASSGGDGNIGVIIAIVLILLILLLLLCLCCTFSKCPERLPKPVKSCFEKCSTKKSASGSSSRKGDGLDRALMVAEPQGDDDDEYGDPQYSTMAKHATNRRMLTKEEHRPEGRSHFSLMSGESLPSLKDNSSLSEAKLDAMKLDEMARTDVPDMEHLLENLGLSHRLSQFRQRGINDVLGVMKLNDQGMREVGLNLGERVKLKRAIDIRKGLQNDPVFGKPT